MDTLEKRIERAQALIKQADYIIIGAGAGLSEAAGFHYAGERYEQNFKDFKQKYGIEHMYNATFYDFETEEEKWAMWSRVIKCNTYDTKPTKVYQKLLELVKTKDYFVITTNVDDQFKSNGFDMNSYVETQGSYTYFQCEKGCHPKVYSNDGLVQEMVNKTVDCKIPSYLVPVCPVCGGPMDVHVRKNNYFVETKGWHRYYDRYQSFIKKALKKKVVFLEFGVGFNTPGIIRYPFEQMIFQNKDAHLIRFNKDYPYTFEETQNKTVSFSEDILMVLNQIEGCENIEPKPKRNLFDRLFMQ